MILSDRKRRYLAEMPAELIGSRPKIIEVDFETCQALMQTIDTYRKRNGKTCFVQRNDRRWIAFEKDQIRYGTGKKTIYQRSVYGLQERQVKQGRLYLSSESKKALIEKFKTQQHDTI